MGGDTGTAGAAADTARRASARSGAGRRHNKTERGRCDPTHTHNNPQVSCASVCVTQRELHIQEALPTPRPQQTWGGKGRRTEVSRVPATEAVRGSNSGRNPLILRGFHDLSQLLWFKDHLVFSADNRISMLTQAKPTPVITFVIKRRPLEEHLVHHTIRVRRFFIAVMTFPQFCLPIPLSNCSGWGTCARWRARRKGGIELHPAHHR